MPWEFLCSFWWHHATCARDRCPCRNFDNRQFLDDWMRVGRLSAQICRPSESHLCCHKSRSAMTYRKLSKKYYNGIYIAFHVSEAIQSSPLEGARVMAGGAFHGAEAAC